MSVRNSEIKSEAGAVKWDSLRLILSVDLYKKGEVQYVTFDLQTGAPRSGVLSAVNTKSLASWAERMATEEEMRALQISALHALQENLRDSLLQRAYGLGFEPSADSKIVGDDLVRFLRGQPTQTEFGPVMAGFLRNNR
ncbi:MAG TPA: hypothetical protein PLV64_22960 [Anaerolineales bacterium]|jgi:hypothetical protein|nr:hypothetical protein [Anaerolineales bacterium]